MKIRRLAVTIVAILVAALGVVIVQVPASAVGCTYGGCTGKDPEVQGCGADAKTVATFTAHYHNNFGLPPYLELRHSNACHSRWVRVKSGDSDWGCGGGSQPELRIWNLTSGGAVIAAFTKAFAACGPFPRWTLMVGRTSTSAKVKFGFRESPAAWCSDSYFNPCKTNYWP